MNVSLAGEEPPPVPSSLEEERKRGRQEKDFGISIDQLKEVFGRHPGLIENLTFRHIQYNYPSLLKKFKKPSLKLFPVCQAGCCLTMPGIYRS